VGRGRHLQNLTDADAIACSEGEAGEFSLVFERHFAAVHRYLHRRLGPSIADDLASETFAIAFRQRSTYDVRQMDARPWLYGIAANLVRHHRRSERRQLLAFARTRMGIHDPEFDAIEARVDSDALRPLLAQALASLRSTDREVLLLHAWADLTYEQISEALNIPVGTVRSRLSRSRSRIRELLRASGQSLDGKQES
jgi:RNA polymerase sigma-70 factor (ECF subfamily)